MLGGVFAFLALCVCLISHVSQPPAAAIHHNYYIALRVIRDYLWFADTTRNATQYSAHLCVEIIAQHVRKNASNTAFAPTALSLAGQQLARKSWFAQDAHNLLRGYKPDNGERGMLSFST